MDVDLAPLLPWLNLIHVLAVMAFILVHGVSGLLSLRIRGERDRARITSMVEVSSAFPDWGWVALAVVFFGGILSGIAGGWWTSGRLWIGASVAVFLAVVVLMTPIGSGYMNAVRHAVGLATSDDVRKRLEPPQPASDEELARIVGSSRPIVAAAIGLGGIAVLTWLMMMKPF
jgi:hypothetical protein